MMHLQRPSSQIISSEIVDVGHSPQRFQNLFDFQLDRFVEVAVGVEEVDTERQRKRSEWVDLVEITMMHNKGRGKEG